MKPLYTLSLSSLLCTVAIISAGAALADPPDRVGRISYVEGNVSLRTGDADWAPAPLNYPVTEGNSYWSDTNAKTEIQVGPMELRLAPSTELDVLHLNDSLTQVQVPQGIVNVHLASDPATPVQVMTPMGEVDLDKAGSYHIDTGANAGAPTVFIVLEGQGQLNGPAGTETVYAGEMATIAGTPPVLTMQEGNPTAFDNWALARERREMAANTYNYVSPGITGASDLNGYGQWAPNPTYGPVWYPTTVQAGWAPYREGHWAYVAPWGWTWIDSAPWGFAPFHYGRWVQVEGRWGWCPGARIERPVYAPALVAFVGGAGLSITAGPAVGWVPLAPFEVFHPYYPVSQGYMRNINIANVHQNEIDTINITRNVTINHYANYQSATVVPSNTFTHGAPVGHALMHVPPEQLAKANVAPAMASFKPTGAAVREGLPGNGSHASAPPVMHRTMPAVAAVHPERPITQERSQAPGTPVSQPRRQEQQVRTPESQPQSVPHAAIAPAYNHPLETKPRVAEGPHEQPHLEQPKPPQDQHHVEHPAQQTQIHPTPQGWVRAPAQGQHPAPQNHPPENHNGGHEEEPHPGER